MAVGTPGAKGQPCSTITVEPTSISCIAPPGVGTGIAVSVSLRGRTAILSNAFNYSAPTIFEVSWTTTALLARYANVLNIRGEDFAPPPRLAVHVGALPCAALQYLNGSFVVCTTQPGYPAGSHSVVLFNGMQFSNSVPVDMVCDPQYYAVDGEVCRACPMGGVCLGGAEFYADSGWFKTGNGTLEACAPPAACAGGPTSACALGYVNFLCNDCAENYYRLRNLCVACPGVSFAYIAAFLVLGVAAVLVRIRLKQKRINVAALSICLDFLQIIAMIAAFNFRWPATVSTALSVASAAAWTIQGLAPECAIPETILEKWLVVQSCPVVLVTILVAVWLASTAYRRFCSTRRGRLQRVFGQRKLSLNTDTSGTSDTTSDNMIGVGFSGLYYMYISLLRGGELTIALLFRALGA